MWNEIGKKAKQAAKALAQSSNQQRISAVCRMADRLECNSAMLMVANGQDLQNARKNGMSEAMIDRLRLTSERIAQMANGLRELAEAPDPMNRVLMEETMPNGLLISKVSVPLGVIAVIYESRPNVTADAAGLCLRAGNACILRGGREAQNSNEFIAGVLRAALSEAGLPEDGVQLLYDPDREGVKALLRMRDYVDLLIPRGGKGLIDFVTQNAIVPVLQTGEGVCHIYVDKDADLMMAADIIYNAKVSRPSVCNACECMLIHQDVAEKALPLIHERLKQAGVIVRADQETLKWVPDAQAADETDWGKEYLSLIIASRVVDDLDEAIEHISRYGTLHSEAIITENPQTAKAFLDRVDAAAVYHNASTRFTDGGEFGFGAEIGISTQKLHARGPVGLNELTSYRYQIRGEGQTR
ncbi:MAG: glutamate-5-semialdehyde dehydrogenase [Bacillota bacterium]|nr:glutamate-5-semialdehyde dehydrogenase [Bacillota bacterium]